MSPPYGLKKSLSYTVGERGACWNTFYFLIFHIFSVLANLNVRAQLSSDTLGLQPELYNFHAVYTEVESEGFFPNFCTCANLPLTGATRHVVKIHVKSRYKYFKVW
jgi:hypothetical protein